MDKLTFTDASNSSISSNTKKKENTEKKNINSTQHSVKETFSPTQNKHNDLNAIEETQAKSSQSHQQQSINKEQSTKHVTKIVPPSLTLSKNKNISIAEYLLSNNVISEDQLKVAQIQQSEYGDTKELGNILVELGFITSEALADILAQSTGVESLNLHSKDTFLDAELIKKLPQKIAAQHNILPIELNNNKLKVATSDVKNVIAFDEIQRVFGNNIEIVVLYAPDTQIRELIDKYYRFEMSLNGILKEIEELKTQQQIEDNRDDYVNPNVRLVNAILTDAVKKEASDIHFEPDKDFVRLRYRIDGKLQQMLTFHKRYWPALLVRLKVISNMNIAETRNPQDGRLTFNVLGRGVDFRVSSQPTVHGENVVARILDMAKAIVDLDLLGMSKQDEDLLKKLLMRPEGIVIVTGPTGSGKTTTLYSILSYINTLDKNIMTLEDPVEYKLPIIRQSNVTKGTDVDFAHGIRAILRQDPDVIFIGEIRDKDTATTAMRAAMTGHQVFSTLHTNDAIAVIQRMIDIGVSPNILAGSVICSIAQRLVRRLCVHCKEEYLPDAKELKILGISSKKNVKLYRAKGCDACYFTGYRGRIGIFEILPFNEKVNGLVAKRADSNEIYKIAKENLGFRKLYEDGITKVLDGTTSLAELISVVDLTDRL